MTCLLKIHQVGPFVSLQDKGRPGYLRYGVPASGPMDRVAFAILQTALDQGPDFTAIEVSLGGLVLTCDEGAVTAGFVGGDFLIDLDGNRLSSWSVFTLEAGQKLTIRPGPSGSWGYLGFVGKPEGKTWLDSTATQLTTGLAGHNFLSGDKLTIDAAQVRTDLNCLLTPPDFAGLSGPVRVVLGPQDDCFAPETVAQLTSTTFTVSQNYDRMGMRLEGVKLPVARELTMPSEALIRGCVQVAGHGDPTILLADHQTTGGYPKMATVITADLDPLVQKRSGDDLSFTLVDLQEAVQQTREKQQQVQSYLERLPELRGSLEDRLWKNNLVSGAVGTAEHF
ncbi:biotin-dependent carboxyltransferase family protein [Rhodovibrionaceae bacterium A322]